MAEEAAALDQDGFPVAKEGRTRRAPPRTKSRSSPRRAKSAVDALQELATASGSRGDKGLSDPLQASVGDVQADILNMKEEDEDFGPRRGVPRRSKSSAGQMQHTKSEDLYEMAKAQAAKRGGVISPMPDKGKIKVIVRKKKKDGEVGTVTPSPGKHRKAIKVPPGSMDFASFDTTGEAKAPVSGGFNPNNIEKSLASAKVGESKRDGATRGREVLHKEGRARSRSRARRSTRSRSRGRLQSANYNLDENVSDSDEEDEEDLSGVDVVDGILQNRRDQGIAGLDAMSSPKTPTRKRFGRSSQKEKEPMTAPLLVSGTSSGKPDANSPVRERERVGRDRFTDASEWSNVVDDLIQKRRDGKDKDAEADEDEPTQKGLGRLFVPRK